MREEKCNYWYRRGKEEAVDRCIFLVKENGSHLGYKNEIISKLEKVKDEE